jgi:predicted methyltransferase
VKRRLAALFLAAALPAFAQAPVSDLAPLIAEAKADKAIAAALGDRKRDMGARLRDDARHAELILRATYLKPGQRALDMGAGSGYLSILMSNMVGPQGGVTLHNATHWIPQFPSMDPAVLAPRIGRANIDYIVSPWHDIPGTAGSYDVIVMGQVYHDAILEGGDIVAMNQRFFELLKPGGRVVIEDHDAIPEMHIGQQASLHRVSHADTTAHLLKAGFVLEEVLLIESKYDDRRFNVFKPGVRGRTDRFIATFRKPTG